MYSNLYPWHTNLWPTSIITNVACFLFFVLHQAPLCVEGWDDALHEIGRLSHQTVLPQQTATSLLKAIEDMPVLVIAGAEDGLVPLKSSQTMATKLLNSVSITSITSRVEESRQTPKFIGVNYEFFACRNWWRYRDVATFHMKSAPRHYSLLYHRS